MIAATRALASGHQPLIRFVGKRVFGAANSTPAAHPASPTGALPETWPTTFAAYRQSVQQHGPLGRSSVGATSGSSLGSVTPETGTFFDRTELPARFQRLPFSAAEIDAVESGGASAF